MNPGALIAGLSGTIGNAVIVRYGDGSVHVRQRVVPSDPRTALQVAARERMRRAATIFRQLSPAQARAWQDYAERLACQAPPNGPRPDPRGQSSFVKLTTKLLQVDPGAAVPLEPPVAAFVGDSATVSAEGSSLGVTFTASGPNSAGVVTELLLQPLRTSLSRAYLEKLRTQGFVAFAPGSLSATAPAVPGWYAPAYRFVLAATGQTSPLVVLPAVAVG
jgi:hypothetical protein